MPTCAATSSNAGVLTNALALVDCYTEGFVFDVYDQLFGPGTAFSGTLTAALVLYVAIYGVQLTLGNARLSLGDVGPRMLKIGFLLALLSSWPTFERLVVDVAFGAPMGVAAEMLKLLGTGGETGVTGAVDAFYDRMMDAAGNYIDKASLADLDYYAAAGFVWAVTVLAMLFAFGFLLVAKLATALILGAGPFFIALFLFAGTRGLFEGWLRALLSFALVPMFLLTSLAMLMAMVDGTVRTVQAEALAGAATWDNLVLLLVVTAGFALLFMQIPQVTAAIAGGISIGGIGSAMAGLGLAGTATGLGLAGRAVVGAGALALAMRSPAARARTFEELAAARRRVTAGLGERTRWWNRLGATEAMRAHDLSKVVRTASQGPDPARTRGIAYNRR